MDRLVLPLQNAEALLHTLFMYAEPMFLLVRAVVKGVKKRREGRPGKGGGGSNQNQMAYDSSAPQHLTASLHLQHCR